MLTEIKLTNFKCFKEETAIPLSQFNLFTGVNGAGKSTVLQTLLLMRQSIEHDRFTNSLILNGSCINLGAFNDVRNKYISNSESIYIKFTLKNSKLEFNDDFFTIKNTPVYEDTMGYRLEYQEGEDMSLYISQIEMPPRLFLDNSDFSEAKDSWNLQSIDEYYYKFENYSYKFKLYNLMPYYSDTLEKHKEPLRINFSAIHFISANRIGPQDSYSKSNLSQFAHVGTQGEFAISLLNKMSHNRVNSDLCLDDNARILITQTEAWLSKILNPLSLKVNNLGKSNYLELLLGDFKPSNVGFGYSSILPIIVTGLIAKPNEKIIIENPEIHLHPKAQSALIEFLVKVANTGVQIFIESHSDHILNALRIATKNNLLKPEDSSILFFDNNTVNNSSDITSILIDEKGKLHRKTPEGTVAKIPKGFFDEWTNSMAKLF